MDFRFNEGVAQMSGMDNPPTPLTLDRVLALIARAKEIDPGVWSDTTQESLDRRLRAFWQAKNEAADRRSKPC